MTANVGAPEWLTLHHTLSALEQSGAHIPCRGSSSEAWTSEDAETKRHAAEACTYCPALALCSSYADAARESWHVWAGRDRTRKAGRAKKGATHA